MHTKELQNDLPTPVDGAIFYEDKQLYACLANEPIVPGHCVVVWKDKIKDLHCLNESDYEYLMDAVDNVRNAMMNTLKTDKVYLFYLDEIKHVHWHLIPRTNSEQGFTVIEHTPKKLEDTWLAEKLSKKM